MQDPGKETRLVEVKGRQLVVRQLTDAQYMLMTREARLAARDDASVERKMTSAARIMDILETAVVQESDRDYLLDLTAAGELEMRDLFGLVTAFADEKPKVRRGRAAERR